MRLKQSEILIVDCQATGANPQKGHLIEIGWMQCRPDQNGTLTSTACNAHLIRLPEDVHIPKRVERVTGILSQDLSASIDLADAWSLMFETAQKTALANGTSHCPTIIHFARYETPFLRFLHHRFSPDAPFPFEIICTQIGRAHV